MNKIKLNEEENKLIKSFNVSQNESNKGLIGIEKDNNVFNILNQKNNKKSSNEGIPQEIMSNLHQNTQMFLKKSLSKNFKEDEREPAVEEEEKTEKHLSNQEDKGQEFNSEDNDSNQMQTPKDEEDANRQLFRKEKIVKRYI